MVWDTSTGERLYTLRDKSDNMMALQDLAIDAEESTDSALILVSASSDPYIRRWRINLASASQIFDTAEAAPSEPQTSKNTILQHETSVYNVVFVGDDEDSDLWTASADGSAKCLSRAKKWGVEEAYVHGDYVRAVVVTPHWAVTAGRDEDVKVWNRATGKLWHIFGGHYEEVTGLVLLNNHRVLSVSIDGTIRSWGLDKASLDEARKESEDKLNGQAKEKEPAQSKSLLTEEEEAELADLMGSDED
jgi:WD40 repeat protein